MTLALQPIDFDEACEFVRRFHRNHKAPQGHKFSVAANDGEKIVAVACVGRPVSRMLDDGYTLEITRLCSDGTRNACSMLYRACWRAGRALGYRKVITYILATESGASLRASGFRCVGECGGGTWNRRARPRVDTHPLQLKMRWECE